MSHFNFCAFLSILLILTNNSYAKKKEALLINCSSKDNVLVDYRNVLFDITLKSLSPGDTLRIPFDEHSFLLTSIVFVPKDLTDNRPVLAVSPGDVISVRYDQTANTYEFFGKQAAELAFYHRLWRSPLRLAGLFQELSVKQMPATMEGFMQQWQRIRHFGDSLLQELRTNPGIRPAVAAALRREVQMRMVRYLLRPAAYYESYYKTTGTHPVFPLVYRDSVKAQVRLLRQLQTQPVTASEQYAHAQQEFIVYLALLQGRIPTLSVQYALAKEEYSGAQREWVCYYIINQAKSLRKPMDPMLKDYRRWMMPESKFVRSLTGQNRLIMVMPNQLMADTDTLIRPDQTKLTLAQLLAQHRGKVIYLDFWASWCGPCLLEIPASNKLSQRYPSKDVVVLYLSIDEDDRKWHRARTQFMPAVPEQYRFANTDTARFLQRFSVASIPRYILLDKYGILRYAEALHPDDPILEEHIKSLLNR